MITEHGKRGAHHLLPHVPPPEEMPHAAGSRGRRARRAERDSPALRRELRAGPGSRLEDALELIDPEVVDHRGGAQGDLRGRDARRQKWEQVSAGSAFHDVSVTIEQNVVSGDTSVNRYTVRGTHTDSGRRYEVLGLPRRRPCRRTPPAVPADRPDPAVVQ
uniref:nuclear transport factor 2 family protein n=1 Tax=Actinomadura sp. CA-154981 TaxID=3240037 RepID=UPI003F492807